ncbi:phosphohistidine phosphatase SixA [Vreelandella neptunia]|uniref:Phosphohistidine phosphatase SixA n=1 Tax=Vreelandella neptunia TaxID=115551 RepID=A0ABZ0YQ92_9GAMM|nr:phosphohistidine phosphatase SixA [Halomonas neptunia]MDN3559371.1 phosphohistidine phosphatase SixA [Halomonas neptunia]TDV99251.1 phosphohistidine phosphatase SixA [Halomonas alkaliantarctica]WQH14324.1 phosphohistidine phosphatase SixA [Halomonas neptunia]
MPDVLIMRHGEAAPGYPDQARRLTPRGELEAEKMARWLAEHVAAGELGMPRIYASPYARAQQTAQRLCDALETSFETLDFITPDDSPRAVSDWLLEQPEGAPIMLVSHMPLVGDLAGLLVEGSPAKGIGFPTAAIAELEAEVLAAGCSQLRRFTQPSQL